MKITFTKYLLITAVGCALAACDTHITDAVDDFEPSAGDADFSTFVVVGDSLSAGYKDGALYEQGQINSYPAILEQQFATVGGGVFKQPLRSSVATGSFIGIPTMGLGSVADRLVVVAGPSASQPLAPATIAPTVATPLEGLAGPALTGPFNNFGVPAAKSFHLTLNTYGDPAQLGVSANPFFVRFASAANATMIGDAALRVPTFFILWIGNNDILLNALAGMPGAANPTFGTGSFDVTPTATFDAVYPGLVAALKTPTNKGILGNIPRVTDIPNFTTVPYNAIPLDATDAATLNAQLAAGYDLALNAAIGTLGLTMEEADRRRVSFQEGQNPILINDETLLDISPVLAGPLAPLALLGQARPATQDDLILLAASAKLGVEDPMGGPGGTGGTLAVWGVTQPLLDSDVLIKPEVVALDAVRAAYNARIKAEADADPDILLFDAAALLETLNATGLSYGSGGISSTFIRGGGFSLDGVHPTARGNAVIANQMMKLIDNGFGANLPPVDPNKFSTIFYQQ